MQSTWTELRTEIQYIRSSGEPIDVDFIQIQREYLKVVGRLNDLLKDLNKPTTSTMSNTQFSLPKLTLPQFSGNASEWKGFISLFDRMIHTNNDVDTGLKIEYLKSCVKGEAFKIISHIDETPDNCDTCYELLKKR